MRDIKYIIPGVVFAAGILLPMMLYIIKYNCF